MAGVALSDLVIGIGVVAMLALVVGVAALIGVWTMWKNG